MTARPVLRSAAGFTLIELVVTCGIVAILAAIAIPSYSSFVRSSHRTDATRTLMQEAQALQRCYSVNFTYVNNTAATPPTVCAASASGTMVSPAGYYSIAIDIASASSYTLTATPAAGSPQNQDSACASFTLLSSGQQSALNSGGASNTQTCWGST